MVELLRPLLARTGFLKGCTIGSLIVAFAGSLLGSAAAFAQGADVHYFHQGIMPPGAIGGVRLARGGPVHGHFQPVEIRAPRGVRIATASGGQFDESAPAPLRLGLHVGAVYRLRATHVPFAEGEEVFPTIEVIDRTYAPLDQQQRFAIPVELTEEDLRLALEGKFVTRVIYLEDPTRALPAPEDPQGQHWFEVRPGDDPLAVADTLGRPVAILRLGGRLPDDAVGIDDAFLYGSPPLVRYAAEVTVLPPPPRR